MAYFTPYIDESGLHLPTYEDRLQDLITSYRAIFGEDTLPDASVPDYQLLSVIARALDDTGALVLAAFNSRNPAYARGQELDLLLPQYGLSRIGATDSYVTLTLTGVSGTVIPAGSVAADTASVTSPLPITGTLTTCLTCRIIFQSTGGAYI